MQHSSNASLGLDIIFVLLHLVIFNFLLEASALVSSSLAGERDYDPGDLNAINARQHSTEVV